MTEAEWLACEDATAMLFAHGRCISERKLRLFAVACCRRIEDWTRAHDTPTMRWYWGVSARDAVSIAERFADGEATDNELRGTSLDLSHTPRGWEPPGIKCYYHNPFVDVVEPRAKAAAWRMLKIPAAFVDPRPPEPGGPLPTPDVTKRRREHLAQSDLLRDIFNPFRPVAFFPEWRTPTLLALAQQMYESRDFSAMPILADSLQDAGCADESILTHCRGPIPHVRGCWVVDDCLGKS